MQHTVLISIGYFHLKPSTSLNCVVSPALLENVRTNKLLSKLIDSKPVCSKKFTIIDLIFKD